MSLAIFDFAKGWLVIQLGKTVEELELVLEKPICLTPGLLAMFDIRVRGLTMLTSLVVSRESPTIDTCICIDELCFSVMRSEHVKGFSYGLPLKLVMCTRDGLARTYDLARVLRPRTMSELARVKVAEVRIKTDSDDCRGVLREVKMYYEFPRVGVLPQFLTRELSRVLSNRVLVQDLEDYLLGLADEQKLRRLRQAGLLRDDGALTRLGQVVVLCLAPHMLTEEEVQSLRALAGQG